MSYSLEPTSLYLVFTACAFLAIAVGGLAIVLLRMRTASENVLAGMTQFDYDRTQALRQGSWFFRWCEPLVRETQEATWLHQVGSLRRLERDLDAGALPVPWRGEELLAVFVVQGVTAGFAWAILALCWLQSLTLLWLAPMIPLVYVHAAGWYVHQLAERRKRAFKQRLPFAIDLMALMIEAGAGFRESLAKIVKECGDHPVGVELGRVQCDVERGQLLHRSLAKLQQRFHDTDINEVVFAVQKAEELGTPLSETFMQLADQMRLKRSQWAEQAAGKAQANITFPGIVVMCACLLIVLAPFAVQAYLQAADLF